MKKYLILIVLTFTSAQIWAQNTLIKIQTTEGDIYLQLADEQAPNSVKNFLSYVNEGFYNGTIFHRVISTFMVQGGGFTEDLVRKPTKDPINNEANNGLKNLRGTIAMARRSDPHSATAQFFINVQDNAAWNFTGEQNSNTWGYAVFGKVIRGMEVVDEIRFTPTAGKKPFKKDLPVTNIVIQSIEVIEKLPVLDSVD